MNNNIEVNIDFNNPNIMALEITKSYLGSKAKMETPFEYTNMFIMTYIRISTELEKLKNTPELLSSLTDKAVKMDFSQFDTNNED